VWLLAVLAILLGLVDGLQIFGANIPMKAIDWFVLAIALELLAPGPIPFIQRKQQ
jgi:hypothetical protein